MATFEPVLRLAPLESFVWIQRSPHDLTHEIQIMLLIQPNCPGCHNHAIPLANRLVQHKRDFDLYCVSTAFEDFEYNTEASARLLLQGKHVGVAKDRLGEDAQHIPQMPVVLDKLTHKDSASDECVAMALEAIKDTVWNQMQASGNIDNAVNIGMLEQRIAVLGKDLLPPYIAEIFYTVRAMGTPTWVVHKADGQVLDVQFGQMTEGTLLDWIKKVTK